MRRRKVFVVNLSGIIMRAILFLVMLWALCVASMGIMVIAHRCIECKQSKPQAIKIKKSHKKNKVEEDFGIDWDLDGE